LQGGRVFHAEAKRRDSTGIYRMIRIRRREKDEE